MSGGGATWRAMGRGVREMWVDDTTPLLKIDVGGSLKSYSREFPFFLGAFWPHLFFHLYIIGVGFLDRQLNG